MNLIKWSDVVLTLIIWTLINLGFLFELAGETVPKWHTISWWAHLHKYIRWTILIVGLVLLFWLVFFHFSSDWIAR
jgi:hypothetical protein